MAKPKIFVLLLFVDGSGCVRSDSKEKAKSNPTKLCNMGCLPSKTVQQVAEPLESTATGGNVKNKNQDPAILHNEHLVLSPTVAVPTPSANNGGGGFEEFGRFPDTDTDTDTAAASAPGEFSTCSIVEEKNSNNINSQNENQHPDIHLNVHDDVLGVILSFLKLADLEQTGLVSKTWRRVQLQLLDDKAIVCPLIVGEEKLKELQRMEEQKKQFQEKWDPRLADLASLGVDQLEIETFSQTIWSEIKEREKDTTELSIERRIMLHQYKVARIMPQQSKAYYSFLHKREPWLPLEQPQHT